MMTKKDIDALKIFNSFTNRPEEWSVSKWEGEELSTVSDYSDLDYAKELKILSAALERGQQLNEEGYYLVFSVPGAVPETLQLQFANGQTVPAERLCSKEYVEEAHYVSTAQHYISVAVVRKDARYI